MTNYFNIASQFVPGLSADVGLAQIELLTWLLLAVIAGIILIFILIAFILLPLARRAAKKQPEAAPTQPLPHDSADATITAPSADADATTMAAPEETEALVAPVVAATDVITAPISGQRPDAIRWRIAGSTDVGLKRELNEDNLMMIEAGGAELGPYGIYVVADGLGGHEAGEIASQITIDTIKDHHDQSPPEGSPFNDWFKNAILAANDNVLAYQNDHKEAEKMGSTLVMAMVAGNTAHIANVGDSRAYQISGDEINQISVDHSLVERLVQIGQITREEARTHKQRNVVYSIIGEKRRLEIGHYDIALAPGDRLLLCSDGLTGMITDDDILQISQAETEPAAAAQAMISAAREAGGHDNITAIIIQMN
jgi:serine/threonine protein phosphatase PrpC